MWLLLMGLFILPTELVVRWTPHPDNVQIVVVYRCEKTTSPVRPVFWAYNSWPIGPDDRERTFRRVPTPIGQKCLIAAQIRRSFEGWDGNDATLKSGEYQLIPHIEEE